MKNIAILISIIIANTALGANVSEYMEQYRSSQNSDFNKELKITEEYTFAKLTKELEEYYADSVPLVQQKAYYLTYKKSRTEELKKKQKTVEILVKGCAQSSGLAIGYNIQVLKTFSIDAFTNTSKTELEELLQNIKMPHYKELLLLAGFVGVGESKMYELLSNENVSKELKWNCTLALARMDSKEHVEIVLNRVKKVKVNNGLVEYILPQLIYIHQKRAIEYCFDLIASNEKLCMSPNPDINENIVCGYRVVELIAPVVNNFPVAINSMGVLETDDYEKALSTVREWYIANKEFEINRNTF